MGVLGGRGGGGGPGFSTLDTLRGLTDGVETLELAYLPASASGGGARNRGAGRGGDGVRSGDLGGGVSCL